jgi:hypothetical protein
MIKIIDFLFRVIMTITFGTLACLGCVLLALYMWDGRFLTLASDIQDQIWKK